MSDRNLNLNDVARRSDSNQAVAQKVAEILTEQNEILDEMVWIECNDGSGHKTTIRTGLPKATWRKLNYGVQPTKSKTAQIKDTCGMLETYSKVDKTLATISGDVGKFRESEDIAFIEGMNQQFVSALFYGNNDQEKEKIMGFSPRFNSIIAKNGEHIIDAGGTGNTLTSMWFIGWGDLTVHGIYPKGSVAGLQIEDKGQATLTDEDGGEYEGYRTHYKWDCGLTVRDWRYVVRIANIPEDLKDIDLVALINGAIDMIPNPNGVRLAFYCNRKLKTALRNKIKNTNNVHLSLDEINGRKVLSFDGIPVRRCDAILSSESKIA